MRECKQKVLINKYEEYLLIEEKSENTIKKYSYDVKCFLEYLQNKTLDKKMVLNYKETLKERYSSKSVNSKLAAINLFLKWLNKADLRVKPVKIQKEIFSNPDRELSQEEYKRLVKTAKSRNNTKLALLIQTICSTGIRVSELKYITVECLKNSKAIVHCKGKTRVIFMPKQLCILLKKYCKATNILSGSIFITNKNNPIDRSNIWKMMKSLCDEANISKEKVFPHNLRHLFARTFYKVEKDIGRLADILGHCSMETTRIYTIEAGRSHVRQIEKMSLVLIN
ncbi:MAG: tyrosine-type recombinase/integrase [Erysipelotrichaceae bacterium]